MIWNYEFIISYMDDNLLLAIILFWDYILWNIIYWV
jgi:hypothetical protein